jgi:hypothetical protein
MPGTANAISDATMSIVSIVVEEQLLRCVECATVSPPGAGAWKAELADDPRDDEEPELAIYCPRCHLREFGSRGAK